MERGGDTCGRESEVVRRGFSDLPVEVVHQILKCFKTSFLEEVCSSVCSKWAEVAKDIVTQRVAKVEARVPSCWRSEVETQLPTERSIVDVLRAWERGEVGEKFEVNVSDVVIGGSGNLLQLVDGRRSECECGQRSNCVVLSLHPMPARGMLLMRTDEGLRFFDLDALELEKLREYHCESEEGRGWLKSWSHVNLSVFREEFVIEETSRALLLLRVTHVDHEKCTFALERIRRVWLPIWNRSLCLFQDKIFVLYTTGFVGLWDRSKDTLAISEDAIPDIQNCDGIHSVQATRIGRSLLIQANSGRGWQWHGIDSDSNPTPNPFLIDFTALVNSVFLQGLEVAVTNDEDDNSSLPRVEWECVDVLKVESWLNCIVILCDVESRVSCNVLERRVYIQRMRREPFVTDLASVNSFKAEIVASPHQFVKVETGSCLISPLHSCPLTLKPWIQQPVISNRVPVTNLTLLFEQYSQRFENRRKLLRDIKVLKVVKVKVFNLPKGYGTLV